MVRMVGISSQVSPEGALPRILMARLKAALIRTFRVGFFTTC